MFKQLVLLVLFMIFFVGSGSVCLADSLIEKIQEQALQGDARAQYKLGREYYRGKRINVSYPKAYEWLNKAAENGSTSALRFLADQYIQGGDLLVQDVPEGVRLLKLAAQQGSLESQMDLGNYYRLGISRHLSRDYQMSAKFYRQAAEQDSLTAQMFLGEMYASGKGVTQNYPEAAKWFRKAAEKMMRQHKVTLGRCMPQVKG